MQTTRLQLNSRDNSIDVYKRLPSTDLKKRYVLRVEQLTIPAMSDGLILNKELFDIERRCVVGTVHTVDGEVQDVANLPLLSGLQVDHVYRPEFIPQNVKTVSQLVYQINAFLRERLVKLTTTDEDFDDGDDWYDIPAEFASQPENSDWYKKQTTVVGGVQVFPFRPKAVRTAVVR